MSPASSTPPRHGKPESEARRALAEKDALIRELIQNYPDAVVLLDDDRRILAANQEALRMFRETSIEEVIGKQPGEALACLHSRAGSDGCGDSPSCRRCGLSTAVLSSWSQREKVTGECCVTSGAEGVPPCEIRATASPLVMDGQPVTLVVLRDVSAEKQRRVLEGLFFHDVLNTVSGLCGLAHALESENLDSAEETLYRSWLVELTTNLEDEIQHHRALLLAERGEYRCSVSDVTLGPLLKELGALYCRHQSAAGRGISVKDPGLLTISTDAALLRRTLGNLLKNALEATPAGGTVSLTAEETPDAIAIVVRNPGVIPDGVRPHLFHRFFSTKGGPGRGLGCYSAKLFGERYLRGRLEFSSTECDGTAFRLTLPCSL